MFVQVGAISFSIVGLLYLLLIVGLPLGEFAFGGKSVVLNLKYRIFSGLIIFVQIFALIILLQMGEIMPLWFSYKTTKIWCLFFAFYISIRAFFNSMSQSKHERFFITPLSVISAICYLFVAIGI